METLNRDEALLVAQCESNGTTDRAGEKKHDCKQTFKRHHHPINIKLGEYLNWRTSLPTKSGFMHTHI